MKKAVSILLSLVLVLYLAACSSASTEEKKTVSDLAGNTVELPEGKICASANSGWITSQIAMGDFP